MEFPIILMGLLFITAAAIIFVTAELWLIFAPVLSGFVRAMASEGKTNGLPRLMRDTRLSQLPPLHTFLNRFRVARKLQLLIAQAGLDWMVDRVLGAMLLIGLSIGTIALSFNVPVMVSGIFGAIGAASPFGLILRKRHSRRIRFDEQLPDYLDSVGHAMQAGHSFSSALALTSKEAPDPVGVEFRLVFEEINFGRPIQDGLESLAHRVHSPDVQYFVMAVQIHSQTGGNLAALLFNLSTLIRDRQRLRKVGQVLSAEGRLSGWILGGLPFLTAVFIWLVNPDFLAILWRDPTGIMLLKVNAVLMTIGMVWMWKLVHFRI